MTKPRIVLKDGESAIFGYGSLLLKRHMELTLGRAGNNNFMTCILDGWGRTWDVIMPNYKFYEATTAGQFVPKNIIYLNIQPRPGGMLNGVLFVVRPEELLAFDRREWIYNRHVVTSQIQDVEVLGGEVFAYVAKPEALLPGDASRSFAAIRRSYLDVVEEGLRELGSEFRSLYERSTQAVPLDLVIHDQKLDDGTNPLLAEAKSHG